MIKDAYSWPAGYIFWGQWRGQAFPGNVLPGVFSFLVFLHIDGIFPGIPAGGMRAVFFDQVGTLAEPPVVFGVVPARFGHIVTQCQIYFVGDRLLVVNGLVFGDGLVDERIGVLAIDLVFKIPGLVVDACADIV